MGNDEGKMFEFTVEGGSKVEMKCTEHTADRRIFEAGGAWIEIDWMEFIDQRTLGRIKELHPTT